MKERKKKGEENVPSSTTCLMAHSSPVQEKSVSKRRQLPHEKSTSSSRVASWVSDEERGRKRERHTPRVRVEADAPSAVVELGLDKLSVVIELENELATVVHQRKGLDLVQVEGVVWEV